MSEVLSGLCQDIFGAVLAALILFWRNTRAEVIVTLAP